MFILRLFSSLQASPDAIKAQLIQLYGEHASLRQPRTSLGQTCLLELGHPRERPAKVNRNFVYRSVTRRSAN